MEAPEVHQPHARRRSGRRKPKGQDGLPRWLELTIAITALVTSVSSIFIAIQHGYTMEKLVQANSVPYLESGFSTATLEGARVLSLDLVNRGVGPAHEESLRVTVDHRPVTSFRDLVVASLGPTEGPKTYRTFHQTKTLVRNNVRKRFIPAEETQPVFRLPRTPENAQAWDLLEQQQSRWNVSYCYCSVFDECWTVRKEDSDSKPVKQCVRNEKLEFTP
jgi:hypothetical protein